MGFDDLLKKAGDILHHAKDVAVEKATELEHAAEQKANDLHLGDLKDQAMAKLGDAQAAVSDAVAHPDQLLDKAKAGLHSATDAVSNAVAHPGDLLAKAKDGLHSATDAVQHKIQDMTGGDAK